jgi:hypothetical protein
MAWNYNRPMPSLCLYQYYEKCLMYIIHSPTIVHYIPKSNLYIIFTCRIIKMSCIVSFFLFLYFYKLLKNFCAFIKKCTVAAVSYHLIGSIKGGHGSPRTGRKDFWRSHWVQRGKLTSHGMRGGQLEAPE